MAAKKMKKKQTHTLDALRRAEIIKRSLDPESSDTLASLGAEFGVSRQSVGSLINNYKRDVARRVPK